MTNMSPNTLLGFADVGNDDHGATEAVKYLLQAVARDIVSLQRNTHVSYMVAERARDIVKAINECIVNVENDVTGDWASYDKFSEAIEPLEE
jgi:DNA-binding LacI/PurR family transcriptional regulator